MAHDVFISYSTTDKQAADAACAALERTGIRCWIAPRDIAPGADWGGAIINAIDHARVTVLIFSSHANASPQIGREIERAISAGSTVMPVRIENAMPTESLAYYMGTVHWLDALTPPLEEHLAKLAAAIKALLGATSAAGPGGATVAPKTEATSSGPEPAQIKRMFSETMNFGFQRNWLQAIGFYVIYLVIALILFGSIGGVVGWSLGLMDVPSEEIVSDTYVAGQVATILYQLLLAVLLLRKRRIDPLNVILLIVTVPLSLALGSLGGLLPVAVLSMRGVVRR